MSKNSNKKACQRKKECFSQVVSEELKILQNKIDKTLSRITALQFCLEEEEQKLRKYFYEEKMFNFSSEKFE